MSSTENQLTNPRGGNLHASNNNTHSGAGRTSSNSLFQTETAISKVDIDDELDLFYKELEQIDPEDVNQSDDTDTVDTCVIGPKPKPSLVDKRVIGPKPKPSLVDKCVIGPKQKPSLVDTCVIGPEPKPSLAASDLGVRQPPPDQQQNESSHNRGQTSHRPDSHTGHSVPPPHKKYSYALSPSNAANENEKLRNIQGPPLQNVPLPPPPPCTFDDRPRYDDLRDSNQNYSWLEQQGPIDSYVHNEYGAGGGGDGWPCDGQLSRGHHHHRFIPNRSHSFRMEPPVGFDTYGQQASSSGWSYTDEQHHQHHWQVPQHPSPSPYSSDSLSLIIMRGAPGSGKSTKARELLSSGPNGLILSTDDYFLQEDGYTYDPRLLSDAHCWNQNRTLKALCEYHSPVIIDNTNMQAWEMKPYVEMALHKGYSVCFQEPNTAWKYEPSELERRNKHGVPKEKIAKMLERFELPMTVDIVLRSKDPSHLRTDHAFRGQRKRRMDIEDY